MELPADKVLVVALAMRMTNGDISSTDQTSGPRKDVQQHNTPLTWVGYAVEVET